MCKEFDAEWTALREELDTEERSRSTGEEAPEPELEAKPEPRSAASRATSK
ncbi:hypothetical protein ACFO0N_03065 [Halobium salinum]|uniref:Uncharacterized protein n=1 Tax=Halobium salinum TaxID=1364940 RepID=A0ABD5P7U3_9EURY|nr:hypothetical protein [Halobium salinum]